MPTSARASERAEALRLFELALDEVVSQTVRVQRIGRTLRIAGRKWCGGRLSPTVGVAVFDDTAVPEVLGALAAERFGSPDGLRILAVFDGTPAAQAGLEAGDELLSLDGTALSAPEDLVAMRMDGEATREWVARVRRDEAVIERMLRPVPACAFNIGLQQTLVRNAATDRRSIWISTGLLRILDDSRLAFVIGHEMGHAFVTRGERLRWPGPRIEARADRFGLFLAALAGFDPIDDRLWDEFQRDLDAFDRKGHRTHPTTWERTLDLRETVAEIRGLLARGEPLDPGPARP